MFEEGGDSRCKNLFVYEAGIGALIYTCAAAVKSYN